MDRVTTVKQNPTAAVEYYVDFRSRSERSEFMKSIKSRLTVSQVSVTLLWWHLVLQTFCSFVLVLLLSESWMKVLG